VSESPNTLLDALLSSLRASENSARDQAKPAAILWTDPGRQWSGLIDRLLPAVPELLVLGEYAPTRRTGPAIWLRCVVDGGLDEPAIPEGRPPILLLPGVARQDLRAGQACPEALQPLVELMYRGALWIQRGGHDWTVSSFLTSQQGLDLEVARDEATRQAMLRALPELAMIPLAQLRGRRLDSEDFDRLLSPDVIRDVLRWMGAPDATREHMGDSGWGAFCNRCEDELGFAPQQQADVTAGELLGHQEGRWQQVWERYSEAPKSYPGIEPLLRRSRPSGILPVSLRRECWPDLNDEDEDTVRKSLAGIPKQPHEQACKTVIELGEAHSRRRDWVWAKLGKSPMAELLRPLQKLAEGALAPLAGSGIEDLMSIYCDRGWQTDASAWETVAFATTADEQLVSTAVRHLLLPWLDEAAKVFQAELQKSRYPTPLEQGEIQASEDGCLLFADGLRYDLGQHLASKLEGHGFRVSIAARWSATPSVTATAKPAVTPVLKQVQGEVLGEDFGAALAPDGRPGNARNLRAAIKAMGYQILGSGEVEPPRTSPARAWMETGDIDSLGHKVGSNLARQIHEELDRLCERIRAILSVGWQSVQVVTDHGWLLMPGGLPKVDLPKHLTASRWARCAVIAGDSKSSASLHPWTWNPISSFAYAPGVACFNKSEEYAHGGLSLQECLTPVLLVEQAVGASHACAIESVTWRGMRCFVEVSSPMPESSVDLRLEGPAGPSVAAAPKPVDSDGTVSLVLAGDEHEDAALALVLLNSDGQVQALRHTRVGEDS
jgi:hypothetical protein